MPLAPGNKLGPYEILAPLGAGGMGEVYRARDTSLGRDVAVKVLASFVALDPERLRRFEQEARAAAALNLNRYFGSAAVQLVIRVMFEVGWSSASLKTKNCFPSCETSKMPPARIIFGSSILNKDSVLLTAHPYFPACSVATISV